MPDEILKLGLSTPAGETPASNWELQFDRADFVKLKPSNLSCNHCHTSINDSYFEANGRVFCKTCREQVQLAVNSGGDGLRLLKAASYGLAAAVVGSGAYYAICRLTGYELGLVSILLGVFIGKAVRKGSGGRGGRRYQAVAMLLTYCAIVCSYIPLIVEEARQKPADVSAQSEQSNGQSDKVGGAATQKASRETAQEMSFLRLVWTLFLLCAILFLSPFLAGFGNFMGWVIIGIGLYEAWKINKGSSLRFTGPFSIGSVPGDNLA